MINIRNSGINTRDPPSLPRYLAWGPHGKDCHRGSSMMTGTKISKDSSGTMNLQVFFILKKSTAFYTCEVSHYQAWRGDVVPITMGPPYPRARHPNINIHRCRVPSLGGGCLRGPLKDFRTCSKYHPPQILWTMKSGIGGG